jgi:hypothetical protein
MTTKRTTTKAGRLLLLHWLRDAGALNGLTLQAIGDALDVNRSTILRDMQELDLAEAEYQRLMFEQPWAERELTVHEFAEAIGATGATVRGMLRDGLVQARKGPGKGAGGRWYIPISEVGRFKRADAMTDGSQDDPAAQGDAMTDGGQDDPAAAQGDAMTDPYRDTLRERIIEFVTKNPGVGVFEISAELDADPMACAEILKELESEGQARREHPATPSAPWENPAARAGWGQSDAT